MGDEDERNGVLRVIPGSHQAKLAPEQLDPAEFLIEAHPNSQSLLKGAMPLTLHRGDVLMFAAGCSTRRAGMTPDGQSCR